MDIYNPRTWEEEIAASGVEGHAVSNTKTTTKTPKFNVLNCRMLSLPELSNSAIAMASGQTHKHRYASVKLYKVQARFGL